MAPVEGLFLSSTQTHCGVGDGVGDGSGTGRCCMLLQPHGGGSSGWSRVLPAAGDMGKGTEDREVCRGGGIAICSVCLAP